MFWISPQDLDIFYKLLSAAVLGGLIGLERESHGKDAGVRTYALVCLGTALIMVVSYEIYFKFKITATDPSRIAAQAVSGIGFLGAGAIMRSEHGSIKGLTTAAGIWATSGIGLACGIGMYHAAIMATISALTILIIFSKLDRFLGGKDY